MAVFAAHPSWHPVRVARWASRLARGWLGTRRRLAMDAHLGSRRRALQSAHDAAPNTPDFVDTQADWQKL